MKITINNEPCYVRWQHVNNVDWNPNKLSNVGKQRPLSYTICSIVKASNNEEIESATAYLGKKEKHFNKDKGRKIALRKAMKYLNLSKTQRTLIWLEYFKETNQMSAGLKAANSLLQSMGLR